VAEAVKVLKGLDERFEFEEAPFGGAGYEASGSPLPEATLALAQQADAVIVGATGVWKYDKLERALRPRAGHSRFAQGAKPIRESAPGGLV
jgi:3-isopropylmalate dehydrogenase